MRQHTIETHLLYIYFTRIFLLFVTHGRALATLGFGSSLPFCAEKRSALLPEIEEPFVALLVKHPSLFSEIEETFVDFLVNHPFFVTKNEVATPLFVILRGAILCCVVQISTPTYTYPRKDKFPHIQLEWDQI